MSSRAIPQRGASRGFSFVGSLIWLASHIFSFEMLFVAFLYSNAYKQLIPTLPVDETVLFAGLCIPVGIYAVLREGLYRPGLNVLVAMMIFFGWIILSLAWTPSQIIAKESISFLLVFGTLGFFSGTLVIANRRERAVRFLILLILASFILAVYGNLIYLQHGSFRFYDGLVQRTYLLWGHAVTSGVIVTFAILLYSRFGSVKQLIILITFLTLLYFLLIATSRGALLSAIGGCLVPLLISRPLIGRGFVQLQQWQLSAMVLVIGGVTYAGYMIVAGEATGTFGRFIKLVNQAQNPDLVLSANRFSYFAAAVEQWIQNPLFGGGVNSFSIFFYKKEVSGAYPHNIILELLSQYGIVGFIIFLSLMATAMRGASLDRLRSDPILLCIFMLFTSQVVGAMFSKELSGHHLLFTYLGMMTLRPKTNTA